MEFVLDIGSHSLKLYKRDATTELVETVTWEPMEAREQDERPSAVLDRFLARLLEKAPGVPVKAFGTELMRRSKNVAAAVEGCCRLHGVPFQVISQELEAALIVQAVHASRLGADVDLDIVNVGGGSIQIVSPSRGVRLRGFGIGDLNERFALNAAPSERALAGCQAFLLEHLPASTSTFVYTGGEYSYLRHFDVAMTGTICRRDAFTAFARELERQTTEELMAKSPHDPKWMKGAIASNCIVLALLERSEMDRFYASDLNIGHGIASQFN